MSAKIVPFDFEGHAVSFNTDGWINATEAARKWGKRPKNFLVLDSTIDYMREVAEELYADQELTKGQISALLVRVDRGRSGGTWLHPELGVEFARWLTPKFARWCDRQIKALIRQQSMAITDQQVAAFFTLTDAASWEKRFMDTFYVALSRMSGLPFVGHKGGSPALFGKITHEWVYRVALHPAAYRAAREKCRPGDKIHQWLSDPALRAVEAQLISITSLANGCVDYKDFVARCERAYGHKGQLSLIYPAAA